MARMILSLSKEANHSEELISAGVLKILGALLFYDNLQGFYSANSLTNIMHSYIYIYINAMYNI